MQIQKVTCYKVGIVHIYCTRDYWFVESCDITCLPSPRSAAPAVVSNRNKPIYLIERDYKYSNGIILSIKSILSFCFSSPAPSRYLFVISHPVWCVVFMKVPSIEWELLQCCIAIRNKTACDFLFNALQLRTVRLITSCWIISESPSLSFDIFFYHERKSLSVSDAKRCDKAPRFDTQLIWRQGMWTGFGGISSRWSAASARWLSRWWTARTAQAEWLSLLLVKCLLFPKKRKFRKKRLTYIYTYSKTLRFNRIFNAL